MQKLISETQTQHDTFWADQNIICAIFVRSVSFVHGGFRNISSLSCISIWNAWKITGRSLKKFHVVGSEGQCADKKSKCEKWKYQVIYLSWAITRGVRPLKLSFQLVSLSKQLYQGGTGEYKKFIASLQWLHPCVNYPSSATFVSIMALWKI